jgi:hypothetical protein
LDALKRKYVRDKEKRNVMNSKLAESYRKRIENFVISSLEKPIVVTDYKAPNEMVFHLRDEQPEKFLGDAQIYVKGFKHEKDRLKYGSRGDKQIMQYTLSQNQGY